ncbi:FxsA family protein [Nocardioides montaniterrae]
MIIKVGSWIGLWPTIALLLLDSVIGTWLIRREGARAWRALNERVQTGRVPHRELADGALVVLGGALMLSPGFVTDVIGILLILPVTRPLFRRLVISYAGSRATTYATGRASAYTTRGGTPGGPGVPPGDVVRGDVVD